MHKKTSIRNFVVVAILTSISGCETFNDKDIVDSPSILAVGDPACTVEPVDFAHIYNRHCDAANPNSGDLLLLQYCDLAGAITFCSMVQNAAVQTRVVQPDGRIRYDANLGSVVGRSGQKCGRMVMRPDGTVVTEFPETGSAPNPATC